jgi:hypothetical protein
VVSHGISFVTRRRRAGHPGSVPGRWYCGVVLRGEAEELELRG